MNRDSWISVEDGLPEKYKDVWVSFIFHNGNQITEKAYRVGDDIWWRSCDDETIKNVTHWMPLPEAPEVTK